MKITIEVSDISGTIRSIETDAPAEPQPVWTDQAPTEPGWYWFAGAHPFGGGSAGDSPIIVVVARARHPRSLCAVAVGDPNEAPLDVLDGHWLGPLPVPAPPNARSA